MEDEYFVENSLVKLNTVVALKNRLKKAKKLGIITQQQYEQILSEGADLRLSKVADYGEERYDEEDWDVQLWMTYCDVWRKFSRIRQLIRNILENRDLESAKKLRDDYLDLLNYGAMGVQIMDRLGVITELETDFIV